MTISILTGALLILLPVFFNLIFFLLQRSFDYPDILRQPPHEVLVRFRLGGTRLVALWYSFMLTSLLFILLAILLPQVIGPGSALFVVFATTVGVLAGLLQALGLIRWPFLVPLLARIYTDPAASQATRDSAVVVFQAFHRYTGVAIGEHLGYLFTSLWTLLIAAAMTQSPLFPAWLGWLGLIPAAGIFLGVFEEAGFKAAGAINAISYILWSLWLISMGVFLLAA
jgi:hypothetical protein